MAKADDTSVSPRLAAGSEAKQKEQQKLREKIKEEQQLQDPIITLVKELNAHVVEDPLQFE